MTSFDFGLYVGPTKNISCIKCKCNSFAFNFFKLITENKVYTFKDYEQLLIADNFDLIFIY